MKVADLMTSDVQVAGPDEDIVAVAKRMAEHDLGFLPVVDGERLVGTITDRDIVVRHVATGAARGTVRDAMSATVRSCSSHDAAGDAVARMGEWQLRRLPVVDGDALVGVVSLADAAREQDPATAGSALGDVVQPGASSTGQA